MNPFVEAQVRFILPGNQKIPTMLTGPDLPMILAKSGMTTVRSMMKTKTWMTSSSTVMKKGL